jgi:predicted transcriptional regulator
MAFLTWRYYMSKQAKLLSHLQAGNELTAKQIKGSFGIAHPASAVRNLREKGYCVYSNSAKLADGTPTVKYRIGVPSKRMIAIVNAVVGASAFTAQRTR